MDRSCWTKKPSKIVSELEIFPHKGAKVAPQKNMIFLSLQTSLLCIVGELGDGGSMAVAVGVSNIWHNLGRASPLLNVSIQQENKLYGLN